MSVSMGSSGCFVVILSLQKWVYFSLYVPYARLFLIHRQIKRFRCVLDATAYVTNFAALCLLLIQ